MRTIVDLSNYMEVRNYAFSLGVTSEEVQEAAKKVGNLRKDIEKELSRRPKLQLNRKFKWNGPK